MTTVVEDASPGRQPPAGDASLLDIKNLSISFPTQQGIVRAVNGVRLNVGHREKVGIVGESGSGKSVTALSILRLLPTATIEGEIWFDGMDILQASEEEVRAIRGRRIGYIFQNPLSALNPVQTIGQQLTEPLRIRGVGRREATERGAALLDRVGIKNPRRRMKDHPHRVLRGYAAAGHHRHGPHRRARPGHRRRAHDGARRPGPGTGARPAGRTGRRAPPRRAAHHPRPGHPGRLRRTSGGHVRRPPGGEVPHRRALPPLDPPLHDRASSPPYPGSRERSPTR